MQYLLTEVEFNNLTSLSDLVDAKAALEIARQIIVDLTEIDLCDGTKETLECGKDYCIDCPIYEITEKIDEYKHSIKMQHLLCSKPKKLPK